MADRSRRDIWSGRRRFARAGVLLALLLAPAAPIVHAQEGGGLGNSRYWFEETQRVQRTRPAQGQRIRRLVPHRQFAKPTIWHERPSAPERVTPQPATPTLAPGVAPPDPAVATTTPDAASPQAKPEPPKTDAATAPATPAQKPFVVAVVGDNLAQWLATGLTEAFPAGGGVSIVNKSRDSSGLVREDFYDWPKALRDIVNTNPDALVVMVGSNDRQPLRGSTGAEEPLSKGWEAIYGKRIEALVAIAKDRKIPILWVGMPIMKSERYSSDIGVINEIAHARAEAAGATFIDVYDAFADEKGAYSAFGPDVNGQIVKLRTGDGIHFTVPGARKLAHFVESDLRRLHEATAPPPPVAALPSETIVVPPANAAVPPAIEGKPVASAPEPPPERPAAGPVMPLTAAPVSPGGELLGRPGGGKLTDAQRATVENLVRTR